MKPGKIFFTKKHTTDLKNFGFCLVANEALRHFDDAESGEDESVVTQTRLSVASVGELPVTSRGRRLETNLRVRVLSATEPVLTDVARVRWRVDNNL